MKKSAYSDKIELKGEQAYDKISSFLSGISFGSDYIRGKRYYFLDISHEDIAKLDPKKKTVVLTDKVEGWIIDDINNINNQGEVNK